MISLDEVRIRLTELDLDSPAMCILLCSGDGSETEFSTRLVKFADKDSGMIMQAILEAAKLLVKLNQGAIRVYDQLGDELLEIRWI